MRLKKGSRFGASKMHAPRLPWLSESFHCVSSSWFRRGMEGSQIPASVWRSGLASACGYPMPGAGASTGKLRTYGVPTEGQRHKVTEVVYPENLVQALGQELAQYC